MEEVHWKMAFNAGEVPQEIGITQEYGVIDTLWVLRCPALHEDFRACPWLAEGMKSKFKERGG